MISGSNLQWFKKKFREPHPAEESGGICRRGEAGQLNASSAGNRIFAGKNREIPKMQSSKIIAIALEVLREEAKAIAGLEAAVNKDFVEAVGTILQSTGRVIVSGIGKSSDIGRKFSATLNSTGTPSFFMHAAEAIHGDFGMLRPGDVVVCFSKSGDTPEIKALIPMIRAAGNPLIAIVGNRDSYLGKMADISLDAHVEKEACPNNLAPTASTAAQLALGDALAVALLTSREFGQEDFARLHPGGALGKKLNLRVADLYLLNQKPIVDANASVTDAIIEISSKRLGCTAVTDKDTLCGIITDGDLRRMMQKHGNIQSLSARDIMTTSPRTIEPGKRLTEALDLMRHNNITQLLVTENSEYLGVIHLHDILKEGII